MELLLQTKRRSDSAQSDAAVFSLRPACTTGAQSGRKRAERGRAASCSLPCAWHAAERRRCRSKMSCFASSSASITADPATVLAPSAKLAADERLPVLATTASPPRPPRICWAACSAAASCRSARPNCRWCISAIACSRCACIHAHSMRHQRAVGRAGEARGGRQERRGTP